ncbi:hypothetical protein D9758_010923 [Tetrapyrgos nigripes]|uniref:Uncharacterized protein n=1 Tax=Tetrapyrgos nigripes TaxID=182062 RepID=A0A8H5FT99_9AGAR|nr:hypothetical protein D9758_010923 [Tetrapyrgos nigripes]
MSNQAAHLTQFSQKSLSGLLQILHRLQLHPSIKLTLPIPVPTREAVFLSEEERAAIHRDLCNRPLIEQREHPSIEYPLHAPTDHPYAPHKNPFYDSDHEEANKLVLLSTISTLLSTGDPSSHFSATLHSLDQHIVLIAKSTLITRSDEKWARKLHFLLTDQRPEPKLKRIENRLMYVEQEMFPFIVKRCSCAINKRICGLREVLDLDFGRQVARAETNESGSGHGERSPSAQVWEDRAWAAVLSSSVAVDWQTTLRTSEHFKDGTATSIFNGVHDYLKYWKLKNSEPGRLLLGILCNMSKLLNDLKFPTYSGDHGGSGDGRGVNEDVRVNVDADSGMDVEIDPTKPWSSKWDTLKDTEKIRIQQFMILVRYCRILYSSRLLQYLAWNPADGDANDLAEIDNEDDAFDYEGSDPDETMEEDCEFAYDEGNTQRINGGCTAADRGKDTGPVTVYGAPVKNGTDGTNVDLSPQISNDNPGQPCGLKRKRSPSPPSSSRRISPTTPTAEFRNLHSEARFISQRELALKIRRRLWKLMVYVDEVAVLTYRAQQTYPDGRVPYYWVGEREGEGKPTKGSEGADDGLEPLREEVEGIATLKTQKVWCCAEDAIKDVWTGREGEWGPRNLTLMHFTHTALFEDWSTVVPIPPKELCLHPEIKLMLFLDVHLSSSMYRQGHPIHFRTPIGSSKRTCWCCAVWLCEFWNTGNDLKDMGDKGEEEGEGGPLRDYLSITPKCSVGEVRPFADWSWALPDEKAWAGDGSQTEDDDSEGMSLVEWTNQYTMGVFRDHLQAILGAGTDPSGI